MGDRTTMNTEQLKQWIARRHPVCLAIAICLFGLAAATHFGLRPLQQEYCAVRFVRIQGALKYIDKSKMEASVRPLLKSGYWNLNFGQIRSITERLPWVGAIQVQRIWPDVLVLRVEEQVPFARFGENRLLSTSGVGFPPADIKPFRHLPWIVGPLDQAGQLLIAFNQMQLSARDLGLTLEKLQVSERESWSVQLADGLIIELGRESPVETFSRFIATLPLLGEKRIQSMVRVDLRYRNGYAVEWKPGAEPEWSSFVKQNDPRRNRAARSI